MIYVRNAWYVASWSHDVDELKPLGVSVLGEPIVLWRANDKVIAFADRCVHRLAPLSLGRCEGATLRCMYHGLLYADDGNVIAIPGQENVPANARVKTYPVVERNSWIWIWTGDPFRADEALIPNTTALDDPDWILGSGHLDYQAEAALINDNLLDFSHLSFVHANSFGAGAEFAEDLPRLEMLPRGVRYTRWTIGTTNPVGRHDISGRVDAFMTYDFLVPGVLTMWNGLFPSGTAVDCQFQRPDYARAIGGVSFTSQAVTPTGDRTARYFFSVGPHKNHGDEQMRDTHVAVAFKAFEEDKVMIEAQQRVIDGAADRTIMPTAHDRSITMFNGILRKLSNDEIQAAD